MGNLPSWAKGKQVECAICGFWYGERDSRIRKRDGKFICKWDWDTVQDKNRKKGENR